MTKIIAIIQGPVASPGRTFQTSGTEKAKSTSNESDLIINFDSSKTILDNVKLLKAHNIDTIYSGWVNDCSPVLQKEIEQAGAKVILSNPKDAPAVVDKNSPFKGVLSINNKSKQFYSIFRALSSISDLHNYIVIKIRSDISFDLDRLLKEINRFEKQILAGGILLQYLRYEKSRDMPILWIPDFLFAARGDVLNHITKDLVNRSLADKSYNDSPHVDLGNAIVRYHWGLFPKLKKDNESFRILIKEKKFLSIPNECITRLGKYILGMKAASLYKNEQLIPASKEIHRSILWRGDSFKECLKNNPEMEKGFIYAKEN